MKKRTSVILTLEAIGVIGFIEVLIVAIILTFPLTDRKESDVTFKSEYHCDVKNFQLSTTIEIDKDNEDFLKVSGNIFAMFTDPLTMYDLEGNKIGYAGDSYHFIQQDSHSIYLDDEISVEMVGLFKKFGDSYDIYNKDEEKIANVTFNAFNTNGEMYDIDGNLIADFHSSLFMNDFDVRITDKCNLDEKAVLLIFCSYYSDQSADSKASSNNVSY